MGITTTNVLASKILLENLATHFNGDLPGSPEGGLEILETLAWAQRWRPALDNIDDTYRLAAILLNTTFYNSGRCEAQVVQLMNDWIDPQLKFKKYPSMRVLADALFGNAWYFIVIESQAVVEWDVAKIVLSTRPAFVGGLVPQEDNGLSFSLPSMEIQP